MSNNYFKEEDKELVSKLMEFGANLIIVDKILAQKLETHQSNYAANDYLDAYFNIENFYSPIDRSRILSNYKDLNPYYATLQSQYGIDPAVARTSKHLTILKANSNALTQAEEELFYDCYYEGLTYYNTVIGTKAFRINDREPNFVKVFLVWSAIIKFISNSMESFFDIDNYDEKTLKNAFISLGLDYFDGMPIGYKRTLLKKIHDIISNKGTNECFLDILSVFGEDTVEIHNYYLVKKFNKTIDDKTGETYYTPEILFYKTPFMKTLDVNNDEPIDFVEMTINDKYWQATKEEIINKDFNVAKTNYLSINSAIDVYNNTLNYSYFFNFLEKAISENKLENTNIYNSRISSDSFTLFEGFVALFALSMRINGYKDKIINDIDVSNYVYGYSNSLDPNSADYVEVNKLLLEIIEEVNTNDQIPYKEKGQIRELLNSFSIERLGSDKYQLKDFLKIFYSNEEIRRNLESIMGNTGNYKIFKSLSRLREIEMRTTCNKNLFKGYNTYSEYLKYNCYGLYLFIQEDTYSSSEDMYLALKEKINDLITSITGELYDDTLINSISRNSFSGLNNYIDYYIKTLIYLFKPYSAELRDESDIYFYKDPNENVRIRDSFSKYLIKTSAEGILPSERLEIYRGKEKLL